MKYFLLIILFLCNGVFANYESSSNAENCAYSTQDTHVVSENYYNRLLAQLNEDETDETKTRNQRNKPSGSGQR